MTKAQHAEREKTQSRGKHWKGGGGEGGRGWVEEDAQGEGFAGQARLKVNDSFQGPWCELRRERAAAAVSV